MIYYKLKIISVMIYYQYLDLNSLMIFFYVS